MSSAASVGSDDDSCSAKGERMDQSSAAAQGV